MTLSDSKLALKWGCDVRTIRRWRKAGAPLASPKKMSVWLASRKNLPPGTAAILSAQEAKVLSAVVSVGEAEGNTGAAGALRRLESAERVTYNILQMALKSGSSPAIKTARENWLAIGNQLRQYDRQVERDRRDSGELIPRSEMEAAAASFMYWVRMAGRPASQKMAGILNITRDTVTISNAMLEQFWDDMLSALAVLASKPGEMHVPQWWIASAIKGLHGAFTDPESAVAKRRQALEHIFEMVVASNAGQRVETIVATAKAPAAVAKVEPVTVTAVITPATPDTVAETEEARELDAMEAQLAAVTANGCPGCKAAVETKAANPSEAHP